MVKTFKARLNQTPDTLYSNAKKLAGEFGARFKGNSCSGNFSGFGVEANYRVVDGFSYITITKKPFIYPWSLVENQIRGFLT